MNAHAKREKRNKSAAALCANTRVRGSKVNMELGMNETAENPFTCV